MVGQAILAVGAPTRSRRRADPAPPGLVGFYGSTPAYRPGARHPRLGRAAAPAAPLTKEGRWDELAALVDDDVLDAIAVRGTPAEAAAELRRRFAGRVDRIGVYTPYTLHDDLLAEIVAAFRA